MGSAGQNLGSWEAAGHVMTPIFPERTVGLSHLAGDAATLRLARRALALSCAGVRGGVSRHPPVAS